MAITRNNGSGQVNQTAKRWNRSAWVKQQVKRWNGSAWVNVSEPDVIYTWTKWGIKTVHPYKLNLLNTSGSLIDKHNPAEDFTVSLNYEFDTVTGTIGFWGGEATIMSAGSGYGGGGSELLAYSTENYDERFLRLWTTTYQVIEDTSISNQTKNESDPQGAVTSTNPTAYPDNGIKDGYWYVKQ